MVYLYDDLAGDEECENCWLRVLSSSRREKCLKYKFDKDRLLCEVSFVLIRYALYKEYGISYMPEFRTDKSGKPFFQRSELFFNVSHCGNAVLVGLDTEPLGLDIQDYTKDINEIRDSFCTDKERGIFTDEKALTRLWTVKEAYGKYSGDGLGYDFKKKDFSEIRDYYLTQKYENFLIYSKQREQYALSICSKNRIPEALVTKRGFHDFADYLLKTVGGRQNVAMAATGTP